MATRLAALERDVESARNKLTNDLAVLRSPESYGEFRSTVTDAVSGVRADAEDRVRSLASGVVEKLKAKAASNPAAVLAIGAGVLWHFARRPPITAALLGVGLINLLRTPVPAEADRPDGGFLEEAGQNLMRQAGSALDATGQAGLDMADAALDQASLLAGEMGKRVEGVTEGARNSIKAARDATETFAGKVTATALEGVEGAYDAATGLASRSVETVRAMAGSVRGETDGYVSPDFADGDGRDDVNGAAFHGEGFDEDEAIEWDEEEEQPSIPVNSLLLGGAGLAVAATLALALYRRD